MVHRLQLNYRTNQLSIALNFNSKSLFLPKQADLQPDANRLVTVYRPRVDRCDRLWFVDTGMMEIPGK